MNSELITLCSSQGQQGQWGPAPGGGSPTVQRPPQRGAPIPAAGGKPFNMPLPPQGAKTQVAPFHGTCPPAKREIVFPADSVEAISPLLYRRKRLGKSDIGTTDPWRIFMCLQSGLLSESTWALDVLNILLFDDTAVQYFGLAHLPGLLTLLLTHFQKSLSDMFDNDTKDRHAYGWNSSKALRSKTHTTDKCDDKENNNNKESVDLGQIIELPNPADRLVVLSNTTNYTLTSRKGLPVKVKEADDDIFVLDVDREWDIDANDSYNTKTTVGGDVWTYGHTRPYPHDHIIDPFKGEFVNIPFARYIKSSDRKSKVSSNKTTEDGDTNKNDAGDKINSNPIIRIKEEDLQNEQTLENSNESKESKESKDSKECNEKGTTEMSMEIDSADDKALATQKKDRLPMDSDCSEVDMELERIPNGPPSSEELTTEEDGDTAQKNKLKRVSQTSFDFKSTVQDPAHILKRRRVSDYEDECYARDEATLSLINENQDTLARRCICVSNILRNLTFVPGNESVLANSETFLAILGKILLLHHTHPIRTQTIRNYDREDDTDFADSCSSLQGESEWWWDYLIQLRENMMVSIANIAGHLQLSKYDEVITRPCLDGLLHWAVCPSAHGQDPFPSSGPHSVLSPQRLALEALCKICVTDANVDLVIATPPFSRLEKLCSVLTRHLCRNEDQVLREFSVNLLHYLAAADSAMARTVALQSPCISYLVAFIEQAEQTALGVANQHGINFLRENPDSMGTSLDMLRRAAGTLLHLARHPDNRTLFLQQEQRLLGLVMSHILDQQVALIISRVLFQVSRGSTQVHTPAIKKKNQTGSDAPTQTPAMVVSAPVLEINDFQLNREIPAAVAPGLPKITQDIVPPVAPIKAPAVPIKTPEPAAITTALPVMPKRRPSSHVDDTKAITEATKTMPAVCEV